MSKEWSVSGDGRKIYSAEFTHDAMLQVYGDFEDNAKRKAYSDKLVEKLNADTEAFKRRIESLENALGSVRGGLYVGCSPHDLIAAIEDAVAESRRPE